MFHHWDGQFHPLGRNPTKRILSHLFELEFLTVYNTKLKGTYGSAMGAYASFGDAYLD